MNTAIWRDVDGPPHASVAGEYITHANAASNAQSMSNAAAIVAAMNSLDALLECAEALEGMLFFVSELPGAQYSAYVTNASAALLDVDPKTVRALVDAGSLRAVRIGKRCLRFDPADVEELRTANAPLVPVSASPSAPQVFGAVYFVRSGEFVKIGFTSTPLSVRLKFLQTGNPHKLETIHQVRNVERSFERVMHAQFAHVRHREEWFLADYSLPHPVKATTTSVARFAQDMLRNEAATLETWKVDWRRKK